MKKIYLTMLVTLLGMPTVQSENVVMTECRIVQQINPSESYYSLFCEATLDYEYKNCAASLKKFEECYKSGDKTESPYYLGMMYINGSGVSVNTKEAPKWFSIAAEHNNAKAQHDLGLLYIEGIGVEKSPERFFFWTLKAAKNGLVSAYAKHSSGSVKQLIKVIQTQ